MRCPGIWQELRRETHHAVIRPLTKSEPAIAFYRRNFCHFAAAVGGSYPVQRSTGRFG
jgi:hypothetical protein